MPGLATVEIVGGLIALLLLAFSAYGSRRVYRRAREDAQRRIAEATIEAEGKAREILVAAQERAVAVQEDAERREQEIDARDAALESRARQLEADQSALDSQRREIDRRNTALTRNEEKLRETLASALAAETAARRTLERVSGLTAEEAKVEMLRSIEDEARKEAARITRRIEEEARDKAHREALLLVVQATQRVVLKEVVASTVTFVRLPSDEMKGRIIGREGRNIRALELATGIDVIVDDTPGAILVSSFDPVRREVARLAIERLMEDGRIHPAKIEEVVAKVREGFESIVEEAGNHAAFELGLAELTPRLARLCGRMKYRYHHGHNMLAHCTEVALIAGHMAGEIGARTDVAKRAGLLHEIGRVDETASGPMLLASADAAARFGEKEAVVHAIQSLHPDVEPKTVEALLLRTANRISDNRPGARKDNLDVFIERLTEIEAIATRFSGVSRAYAVRAGKEVRVIVDAAAAGDQRAYELSREIARAVETEGDYSGEIKISVVRETRAVQYAV